MIIHTVAAVATGRRPASTVVLLIKEGALFGPEGPDFFFSRFPFFKHGDPFIFEFFRFLNMETPLSRSKKNIYIHSCAGV